MQLRQSQTSPTVTLELTTGNGRIQLGSNGVMTLIMSEADTAALPTVNQVYDLELIKPDNTVIRLLKGTVTIDPEVTRP